MKHFIFLISLTLLINANGQIQGVQDYKHWLRKDSIDFGFKGFIYTDLNPYLKHYWYAERFDEEGFKIMRAELSRLLKLNQADINNPSFEKSDDSYSIDLANYNLIRITVFKESKEIWATWEIPDIHNAVEENWILNLNIRYEGISIYVSSSYDFDILERMKLPDQNFFLNHH